MKYLIAILALALLAGTAEAGGRQRFRQQVVVQRVVVQRQHFHAQRFVQPIVVQQVHGCGGLQLNSGCVQSFSAGYGSQAVVLPVVGGHSCGALLGIGY